MYRCRCGKEYQSKTWFQNHRALCELLEDSKKDDIYDDLPSKIEMWNCMKVILKKYETLEKKMQDHEKYIKTQKKKINIIDWLTDNYKPELNYNEWLSNIKITQNDLEILFNCGFIEGVYSLLIRCLKSVINPITCFDQRLNTFFIYKNDSWEHFDIEDFAKLIKKILFKFIKIFKIWKDQNKSFIDNDKNFEIVQKRYIEVMGGRYEDEVNTKKINSKLYKYLKFNLKNIITYEFSF